MTAAAAIASVADGRPATPAPRPKAGLTAIERAAFARAEATGYLVARRSQRQVRRAWLSRCRAKGRPFIAIATAEVWATVRLCLEPAGRELSPAGRWLVCGTLRALGASPLECGVEWAEGRVLLADAELAARVLRLVAEAEDGQAAPALLRNTDTGV